MNLSLNCISELVANNGLSESTLSSSCHCFTGVSLGVHDSKDAVSLFQSMVVDMTLAHHRPRGAGFALCTDQVLRILYLQACFSRIESNFQNFFLISVQSFVGQLQSRN